MVEQGDAGAASADPVMVTKVIQEVTGAYEGQTDDGATVYYALTDDGTQRILALQAADGTYESWVGNATSNGEEVTITDAPSGNTISFRFTPQEGDSALIDLGDRGQAVVAQCPLEVVTDVVEVSEG